MAVVPFTFGQKVRQLRHSQGLTQDVLAERVGCATQTIRKLEAGQRRPSYQMAARMAEVLNLSADERESFMAAARATDEEEAEPSTPPAPSETGEARNLPSYHTPFVGRDNKVSEIVQLLGQADCRLLSLLGAGGIGKTRLAVEVARTTLPFANGVVFVPLAPITLPQAIIPTIGDALGFSFSGTSDLTLQLLNHLRDKELLLILDNFEQLLGTWNLAVGLVGQILAQAPKVKILVTSRERLKLQAEWVVEIEGLSVPPEIAEESAGYYAAYDLFMERARRVHQRFQPSPDEEQAIAKICRAVGGMPLGIELAAAWLRVLSPQEIAQEISIGLDSTFVSSQDLPERHRSLQSVFDHSWQLLSAEEQQVLSRLACFQGGCTREAAAHIAEASLPILAALMDKSLLRRSTTGRYELHELIRQFALVKIRATPKEYRTTRSRHSVYYTTWLDSLEFPLKSPDGARLIPTVTVELENIRMAWEWAVEHVEWKSIQNAIETIHWFSEMRSWFREGNAMLRYAAISLRPKVALLPIESDTAPAPRLVFGQLLAAYGYLTSRLGEFEEAHQLLEESVAFLRPCHDPLILGRALCYLGTITCQIGMYAYAQAALQEAREIGIRIQAPWLVALAATWLSMTEHALGDYPYAETCFREALEIWRAIGTPHTTIFCITFCIVTLYIQRKYDEAAALLQEGQLLTQERQDRWEQAMVLIQMGMIAYGKEAYEQAEAYVQEGLTLVHATGTRWEIARALNTLGAVLLGLDRNADAERIYQEALGISRSTGAMPDLLESLKGLAYIRSYEGQTEIALQLAYTVQQNPASRHGTRELATALYAQYESTVPAPEVERLSAEASRKSIDELLKLVGA